MSDCAKLRVIKLAEQVCEMEYPFSNQVVSEIRNLMDAPEWDQDELLRLLMMLLLGVEEYIHTAHYEHMELRWIRSDIEKDSANKTQIDRFFRYRELQQQKLSDVEIFRTMFDESPDKEKMIFRKFHDRMRKWKHDHSQVLSAEDGPVVYENKLDQIILYVTNDTMENCWNKLSVKGICSRKILEKHLKIFTDSQYKNESLFEYNFLSLILLRIIKRNRWAKDLYMDYRTELKTLSLYLKILNPAKWRELECLASERKVKAPLRPSPIDNKNDICRALVLLKTTPNIQDQYEAGIHTYQRKLDDLFNEKLNIISDNKKEIDYIEYINLMSLLIINQENKRKNHDKFKIKTWNDIIYTFRLLCNYELDMDENILKKIFDVCKEKRDWILPEELELKHKFEMLEYINFFDLLYSLLDKKAVIKELSGIRWHKVPAPDRCLVSPAELLTPSRIYSPFWKK